MTSISPGLNLVQSILAVTALTNLAKFSSSLVDIKLSQPVKANFSQSEEVFYRNLISANQRRCYIGII